MIMFTLITLPYAIDALEPVISARTLEFHRGKHLQGYVDNLNKLLPGSGLEAESLEEIVRKAAALPGATAIFNNAGQILNHNLYFTQFRPVDTVMPGSVDSAMPGPDVSVMPGPTGHLKAQIEKQWGSFDAFKSAFEAAGVGLFGSGWVWLSAASDGNLLITQEPGASNPVTRGLTPLLTFDVWEHAYYLDYQNRRAAQLKELWRIVDWSVVEGRYTSL